ncbi:alkaline shock response membrane anchor protein AmaP [Nonomuraea sp. NN258]|uniref:alkaline shock response membrane anchor protein AmaP n=1 Tax=Nonomuraea antri TaxID=2730852 RepID=UPI001569C8D3|nr:alkaline shock response membrane anchor protein AmaP [Nonomuraea antri]NRQ37220.1 alkaline shock response membrane anchor protein AmaP [Nonomuraea antri]
MSRKTGRGNRWGLALVGLILTLLGALALARGLGAIPAAPAGTPMADGGLRSFFARTSPWIWWAVALVSIVVALLALRWLFAQGRRDTRGSLRLESGPGGVTEVSAGGMAHAVAADLESNPAVLSASADLAGTRRRPAVRLRVVADERAPMDELADHLARVAIPHMREALEVDHVPAVARVSLEPSPAPQRVVQ